MTNEQLLAVLDMSEDEQWGWLRDNYYPLTDCPDKYWTDSLADLAFRLRDEVDDTLMHNALYKIQHSLSMGESGLSTPTPQDYATAFWGLYHAKPIHWIIASLIAKENHE